MRGRRARITLIDVVFIAASLAVLAFLSPALYEVLQQQTDVLGTGELLFMQMLVPAIVLTLLVLTFSRAVSSV